MSPDPLPQNNSAIDQETQDSASPSGLEEVRKRLQSFGYLENRIERFYLFNLSRSASQFFIRFLLSFRVGLLAGTVAAILMSAGALVFNVDLLQRKFDVLLLLFYFEVFFVLLFTVFEFLLIFSVSGLFRIAGGRSLFIAGQVVSFLTGFGFFGYFFYWGQVQIEYLRQFSLISVASMFLILTLSCIFVAKCSWLGFLVAFRESDLGRVLPNWKRFGVEWLLALVAMIVLVPFVLNRNEPNTKDSPPIAVIPTSDNWILVGIDGVSFEILNRFVQTGKIPNIAGLMQQSFQSPLQTVEPAVPPVVWSSIATGTPSIQHGIRSPEVRRWLGQSSWIQESPLQLAVHSIMVNAGFGQRQPVSGYSRKLKTFWEIMSDHGLRAGVVNWWGSWPARPLRGWNISERTYYKLISKESWNDETFPPELFQKYGRSFSAGGGKISGPELDRFYASLFQQQLSSDPVRVAALYLPGFDILNYEFFEARRFDPFVYTQEYERHLQWLDQWLGELHSRYSGYRFMLVFYRGRSLSGQSSGIALSGSGSNQSVTLNEYDVAPLLLYSVGLPLARNMKEDLLRLTIPAERLTRSPVRYVAPYATPTDRIDSAHVDQFNDVLVEQMKSLGYLQ